MKMFNEFIKRCAYEIVLLSEITQSKLEQIYDCCPVTFTYTIALNYNFIFYCFLYNLITNLEKEQ